MKLRIGILLVIDHLLSSLKNKSGQPIDQLMRIYGNTGLVKPVRVHFRCIAYYSKN